MTKREILLTNCIKLHQKEVCSPLLSYHLIPPKFEVIKKLQGRLKRNRQTQETIDHTFFGRNMTYADGTKHFISNTWFN